MTASVENSQELRDFCLGEIYHIRRKDEVKTVTKCNSESITDGSRFCVNEKRSLLGLKDFFLIFQMVLKPPKPKIGIKKTHAY